MWRELIVDSVVRPRAAARRVLEARVPEAVLLQAAVAVACVGMVLGYLAFRATPEAADAVSAVIFANPLAGAVAELAIMAVIVVLTARVGQLFGGSGTVSGALALVVWLNAMMVLVQAVQVVALVVLAPLAALIALATMAWGLWIYANFVTELHGFQNPFIVMGAVVLTAIMLFLATAMLLAILGITPQEAS